MLVPYSKYVVVGDPFGLQTPRKTAKSHVTGDADSVTVIGAAKTVAVTDTQNSD